MSRRKYGMTQGEVNKIKYIKNYERNKYYNGYNKTYKLISFMLVPQVLEDFNKVCKKLKTTKKALILKELEELKNE